MEHFIMDGPGVDPLSRPDTSMSTVAFKRRMTSAERIAIRGMATQNAHVYDYMDLLDSGTLVHLDDPDLIGGLQLLASAGVFAAGRVDQITALPVLPSERPA